MTNEARFDLMNDRPRIEDGFEFAWLSVGRFLRLSDAIHSLRRYHLMRVRLGDQAWKIEGDYGVCLSAEEVVRLLTAELLDCLLHHVDLRTQLARCISAHDFDTGELLVQVNTPKPICIDAEKCSDDAIARMRQEERLACLFLVFETVLLPAVVDGRIDLDSIRPSNPQELDVDVHADVNEDSWFDGASHAFRVEKLGLPRTADGRHTGCNVAHSIDRRCGVGDQSNLETSADVAHSVARTSPTAARGAHGGAHECGVRATGLEVQSRD